MGDKGFLNFPKGISPKVNVIAWLIFERAYYDVSHDNNIKILSLTGTSKKGRNKRKRQRL